MACPNKGPFHLHLFTQCYITTRVKAESGFSEPNNLLYQMQGKIDRTAQQMGV